MFYIDSLSDVPIYSQIRNGIVGEIASGSLKNGDELPSIRQFAKDFEVNPMTVNKAYTILKQEKFIEIDRRVGAIVSVKCDEEIVGNIFKDLKSVITEAKARGLDKESILGLIERGI
ncbi:GntR family transcriptional regulator [Peptostreptococcus sp. D1]|uniref:GntR family transcriptional regulator n=1 Tax=Peptostreptococcus sp. D1 TaxID=72304 RepID=UPI0008EFF245|nr:GntR family transcriptional regulator [Peptostreptococcus sp. D1]SFE55302.1 DNA-binding transcriptional regulator YhcF, GntR family [Peptostreptococcus sp. D1]